MSKISWPVWESTLELHQLFWSLHAFYQVLLDYSSKCWVENFYFIFTVFTFWSKCTYSYSVVENFAFTLFEQLVREDYLQLRQEAMDLQEYSSAKLDRVTRYLGVLAEKTRKLGKLCPLSQLLCRIGARDLNLDRCVDNSRQNFSIEELQNFPMFSSYFIVILPSFTLCTMMAVPFSIFLCTWINTIDSLKPNCLLSDQAALETEARIFPLLSEKKKLFNDLLTAKGTNIYLTISRILILSNSYPICIITAPNWTC